VVNQPESPNLSMSGRVDGKNIMSGLSHPIGLYYVVRSAGSVFSPLLDSVPWQDDAKITPALRFVFSTFLFLIFLLTAIFICIRKEPASPLLMFLFLAVAISPVAIFTSANLQLDGSVGVLMNGAFALGLLFFLSGNSRNIIKYIILFAASFFLATGKQEWSMVLIVALFVVAAYLAIIKVRSSVKVKQDVFMLLSIIVGLIAGNVFSYLIESNCYMGGLEVFWRFSKIEDIADGNMKPGRWIQLTLNRLEWIDTIIALIAISGLFVFMKRDKIKPVEILLWVYGLGLFAAYFMSSWNSEPRYFAPSLVVMLIAVIAVFPSKVSIRPAIFTTVIIVMMFATSAKFLHKTITELPSKSHFDASQIKLQKNEIAILSTANAWNKTELDFVGLNSGKKTAKGLSKKYNKVLYPADFKWWDDETIQK
jgi:hypothetical protein